MRSCPWSRGVARVAVPTAWRTVIGGLRRPLRRLQCRNGVTPTERPWIRLRLPPAAVTDCDWTERTELLRLAMRTGVARGPTFESRPVNEALWSAQPSRAAVTMHSHRDYRLEAAPLQRRLDTASRRRPALSLRSGHGATVVGQCRSAARQRVERHDGPYRRLEGVSGWSSPGRSVEPRRGRSGRFGRTRW